MRAPTGYIILICPEYKIGSCIIYNYVATVWAYKNKVFIEATIDIMVYLFSLQPEDEAGQLDYRYDEFGFKVEVEGLSFDTSGYKFNELGRVIQKLLYLIIDIMYLSQLCVVFLQMVLKRTVANFSAHLLSKTPNID